MKNAKAVCVRLLQGGTLLLLLAAAGLGILLGTESGFQLTLRAANAWAKPFFSAEQGQGRLLGSWQLQGLRMQFGKAVELELNQLAFSWNLRALFTKRELHLRRLAARGLTVRILAAGSSAKQEKPKRHLVLPAILLPLGLRLDEVSARDSRIFFPGKQKPLMVSELLLQAAVRGQEAEIARVKLDSSVCGADLHGQIRFAGAWPLRLSGSWRVPDPGINDLVGTVAAEGDFDRVNVSATMTAPAAASLHGQAFDLLNDLRWQASAESGHFHLRDIKVNVPVDGSLRVIEATGTVKSYRGTVAANAHYEGYPRVQTEAKVVAEDYAGLKVDYLTVRHEAAELTARGAMRWHGGFSWQAELEGKELDPSVLKAQWPGKISGLLRSQGQLAKSGKALAVRIENLHGQLTGIPVALSGNLVLDNGSLAVDGLRLQSGTAQVRLDGQTAANKTVDFVVQADADNLAGLLPEAGGTVHLRGRATGSRERPTVQVSLNGSDLAFRKARLQQLSAEAKADIILQGEERGLSLSSLQALLNNKSALNLKGRLGWANGLAWQAELSGSQIDPSPFAPDWSGNITAKLRSQGALANGKLTAAAAIEQLQGTLRGFPLTGSGTAVLNGKSLVVDDLRLQSGSTQLQISGTADPAQEMALRFKAGSENLASLLPQAGGSFRLEGSISGKPQQPALNLNLTASKLRLKEHRLRSLDGTVKADLAASGQMDADIKAAGIQIKAEQISQAQLRVKGSTAQHRIDMSATGSRGEIKLAADGSLKNQQWQGKLSDLLLASRQFGIWKNERPADLLLSGRDCELDGFALVHDRLRAAGSGKWQQDKGWQAEAGVQNLSLNQLEQWGVPTANLDGLLQLSLTAKGHNAIPTQAELSVALPDLALTADDLTKNDGSQTDWHWQDNQIQARLENDAVRLTARTRFQDGSRASLKAALRNCGDFTRPAQMPLDGQLEVNIRDLSLLAPLLGDMVQAAGAFGGSIAFSGTAANPNLNGTLALQNGSRAAKIAVPAAGISIKELKLTVDGDASTNQAELVLASGQGKIRAKGTVSRQPGEPLSADFRIQGKEFQAADLPEYKAVISPDLRFVYGKNGTALRGTVVVPKALIAPLGFGGAVAPSADVVVVDKEDEPERGKTLPFSLDLGVTLGKEVAVDTFGLKGFLDGSLQLRAKPGQMVTALGSFSLRDSTVAFEGTSLKLNEGRIFYQGGPIENPGLDIRASRKVNKVEAGIHLTGSVSSMDIKLFSDTPMSDAEILSWLMAGQDSMSSSAAGTAALSPAAAALSKMGGGALLKSVNPLSAVNMENAVDLSIGGGKEASDVSLVMGKEIYKNLYISYDHDLTGEGGAFKARYDLGYGFSIETETASKTTGADLLWSLEK